MSANANDAGEVVFKLDREFNAPRSLVWAAYTEPERLAQWWGPKGFEMLTCKVDLRSGGIFHYGMKAPNGFTMWGKLIYQEIKAPERLSFIVSFSDEKAGVTRHPMSATWPLEVLSVNDFIEKDGKTTISSRSTPVRASAEEIKSFKDGFAGMQQGFKGALDALEAYLAKAQS